jgi:hypothetical protein
LLTFAKAKANFEKPKPNNQKGFNPPTFMAAFIFFVGG